MKKYISIIPITLIIVGISISCKKSDTPKDYGASIKDKTWWGQLTYNGQPPEYYAVHFKADSTLIWSQQSGDYLGLWAIKDKKLTMTFPALGSEIKGDISDNDTLLNISDNNASVTINSGKLITNTNINLDNTLWFGSCLGASAQNTLQLSFKPSLKAELKLGNNIYGSDPYTRNLSDAVIRTEPNPGFSLFFVIISGNAIIGNDNITGCQWQVKKQ